MGGGAFIALLEGDEIADHHIRIIPELPGNAMVSWRCWESTGVENPAFHFRLGDGSRLVGGCCVGGGVFLSAASARNRSFMLKGVFYVCSAIANPPPRCRLRSFWTGFRCLLFPGVFNAWEFSDVRGLEVTHTMWGCLSGGLWGCTVCSGRCWEACTQQSAVFFQVRICTI